MSEPVPNPLKELQEAISKSRHLALEMAALQERIDMLAKQVAVNAQKKESKILPPGAKE